MIDLVVVRGNYDASGYESTDELLVFHNIDIIEVDFNTEGEITVFYTHTVDEHGYTEGDIDFDTFIWDNDTALNTDMSQLFEGFIINGKFYPISQNSKESYLKQVGVMLNNAIINHNLNKLD